MTGASMQWPAIVARALRCGGVALLRLQVLGHSASVSHWVLVVGVEVRGHHSGKGRMRALLVLDAAQSDPWVCGYNAKLMLTGRTGRPSPSLAYSSLDGRRWHVRLTEGISLQPQPTAESLGA
jgi:hypothetical protein